MLLEGACGVKGIVSKALRGGLASLGIVETLGWAVTGRAGMLALALGFVVSCGVAGGAAFATACQGHRAVASLCWVGEGVAAAALSKRVRGDSAFYRYPFPKEPDTIAGVCTGTHYGICLRVVSIN